MSKINDGGPAFPDRYGGGMTLRDWFAGQAMQARLTGTNMARLDIRHSIAADAYAIADAMLAAREQSS